MENNKEMFNTLINKENIENFKNHKPFVIRKSGFPSVSWQTVLELLDEDIIAGKHAGKKIYKDNGFVIIEATRIPIVKLLVDELGSIFSKSEYFKSLNKDEGAHQIYISLTTQEGSYGKMHQDPENVIFWQIQGSSTWTIFKDGVDIDIVETLNEGDIIYCPPNRWHQVTARSPRCAISMGFGSLLEVK